MKKDKVYLSFPTSKETSDNLKIIAHKLGKTQPELINDICEDFIEDLMSIIKEKVLLNINSETGS